MEATVVQTGKVQTYSGQKADTNRVFRWSKYVDGEGKLWIVTLTHGFDKRGIWGDKIELLNVDDESTIDVPRLQFLEWVNDGNLKRVEVPILF